MSGFRLRAFPVLLVLAGGLLSASATWADRATIVATPVRILVSESTFGGCMVQLSVDPQSQLPNCGSSWVTMSCDGTFMPKDVSDRLLEQAQMAFALGKGLSVYIDDARRHNGYCLAYRVDIW